MSPMPRKSLEQHALDGTKAHYDARQKTSHIPGARPHAPKFLSQAAKRKFKALARVLEKRRVATAGDAELLTQYVTLWERWSVAQQRVRDEGAVVTVTCYSKNGEKYQRDKKNPWLEVAQVTEKQMLAALVALGLTVSSRDKAKQTAADPVREVLPGSIDAFLGNVVSMNRPLSVDSTLMDADNSEREPE